jgi:hypothetical protein
MPAVRLETAASDAHAHEYFKTFSPLTDWVRLHVEAAPGKCHLPYSEENATRRTSSQRAR